jgi:hypothetical protein
MASTSTDAMDTRTRPQRALARAMAIISLRIDAASGPLALPGPGGSADAVVASDGRRQLRLSQSTNGGGRGSSVAAGSGAGGPAHDNDGNALASVDASGNVYADFAKVEDPKP